MMKFERALQLSLTSMILVQTLLLLKCDIITVVGKNMCLIQFFQTKITYICKMSFLIEAKYLFFRHVQKVIFEEHKIRTLQSLPKEYIAIMENYIHSAYRVKSSFLKTLLICEYGDSIGFPAGIKRTNQK